MKRFRDWPERLSECIERHREIPFSWGIQDCVTFAAHCIFATTGETLLEGFDHWSTEAEANHILDSEGGLEKAVEKVLGTACAPALAQRGDVVMMDIEGIRSLGICLGSFAAGPARNGLAWVEMSKWLKSWKVGHA